ncbi:MAG: recombinase RecA [Candidatus Entotheonella factor]|uniref:non-specific serine/threonine protein kinase n=1 Tax=Entotheonella factor TaxID=1429438 RepID=W4LFM7_ENTF1|nr:MAG: recombinase RecA [Candidatus Entotheonella factor]
MTDRETLSRMSTGIPGLDEVLGGGLLNGEAYLVRGGPGTGKTTLGAHFLTAGVHEGESVLWITLGEPEVKLHRHTKRQGFQLDGVTILDLSPTAEVFAETSPYNIFASPDVERDPITQQIIDRIDALQPSRVFIDSMTQLRYLSTDAFQFRKQTLAFLRFLTDRGSTIVVTSEGTPEVPDHDLQFMCDGVLTLTNTAAGRSVCVSKFRGSHFRPGEHTIRLGPEGMIVFPRLIPETQRREFVSEPLSSGVPELDELLHGGLEQGTISIITGPTGAGKTTLGLQFIKEAAGRGIHAAMYSFEEGVDTLTARCESINIPIGAMVERGTLSLNQVEPLRYTPDEFAHQVRHAVEDQGCRIVMIDSISGYSLAMHGRDLVTHLHALSIYLKSRGITVLLISEVEMIMGEFRATDVGVSYLADNVVFLRHLEINGEMRKAIGVLKKRAGNFERTLRELQITRYGLKVGEPLTGLRSILSGTPEFIDPE